MSFLELIQESFPLLMMGMGLTLELSVVALLMAMLIGLGSCLLNISKNRVFHAVSQGYINIIRGTPLLVQAFFIYFGVTQAIGMRMPAFTAGVIALSLNAGAYLSEVFRGGIQAVSAGQMEAARSLGMPYRTAMLRIILPQALRVAIPSIVNQCCITIKDTSIISVIGLAELTMRGQQIIARTYRSFEVWILVGVLYFIIIYAVTKLSQVMEKRLSLANKGGDQEPS
ncbi:MAG: amino acid ABC transporter permease [Coriobacteriales bacterium]|jgi:His/Glu/Gln/Arg/opine family amino acid ABC transporter permease subunit|nr:amino acid ABC transporter permease [Coriobacteriales bacterium]